MYSGGGVLWFCRRYAAISTVFANTSSNARKSFLEYFHMFHVDLYRREDSPILYLNIKPAPPLRPSQNCIFF